ncbi:MAG: GNAT family N-acetyltransferase [Gaiellaceae bacterium]
MLIRSPTRADESALVDLQRRASLTAYAHIFPPEQFPYPLAATKARWNELLSDRPRDVFIAQIGGLIAGVVVVVDDTIQSLFVDPDRWRGGIGSALMDQACNRIAESGHAVARLWVMEPNLNARSFYESAGWSADGRSEASSFPPHPTLVSYSKVVSERRAP